MKAKLVSCGLLCLSGFQEIVLAQNVVWNYDGMAMASGVGCQPSDTFFVFAGAEISVVLSEMKVDLSESSDVLTTRLNCSIRLPLRVAPGHYISGLTQTVLYGVKKTYGAGGSISLRSEFFDLPAGQFNDKFQSDIRRDEPLVERTVRTSFPEFARDWCRRRRSHSGQYTANLAMAARRMELTDSIFIGMEGQAVKLELVEATLPCPSL